MVISTNFSLHHQYVISPKHWAKYYKDRYRIIKSYTNTKKVLAEEVASVSNLPPSTYTISALCGCAMLMVFIAQLAYVGSVDESNLVKLN